MQNLLSLTLGKIRSLLAPMLLFSGVGCQDSLTPPAESALSADTSYRLRPSGTLTFNKDIAPIIFQHCATCHRPEASAPFSLLTYQDVKKRATQIVAVTSSGFMPPWLPEPGYVSFAGERRLQRNQLGMLRQWADEGSLEGDTEDLSSPPTSTVGWQLGTPDMTVRMTEPFRLSAEGSDVYRNFVLPISQAKRRYVQAVEFRAGNPRIVHHARVFIDSSGSSHLQDQEDQELGFEGMSLRDVHNPQGHFLGWTPGRVPQFVPEGMCWPLEKETDLVLQLHMLPTGKEEIIQATLGFFFGDEAPNRIAHVISLGTRAIDIPAGEPNYVVKDTYTLPVDVDLLSVYPHAHYLGKDLKAYAVMPDGTKEWLLRIKDWDFFWQDDYRYEEPVFLPQGTTLVMVYTYDNSAENVRNPNQPPKRVVYGNRTRDEMADLVLQVLPGNDDDLAILKLDFAKNALLRNMVGYKKMLEVNPEDAQTHNSLGVRYLAIGELEKAQSHFQNALRLNPNFDFAHNNLAKSLSQQGRYTEAITYYHRALEISPHYYRAQYNLAEAWEAQGNIAKAIENFRQVLAINPRYAPAEHRLALVLARSRQFAESLQHAQRAVKLEPDVPEYLGGLAMLLVSYPKPDVRDPERAVVLAERAAKVTKYKNPRILATLGAVYAAAGQSGQAEATTREAWRQAKNSGDHGLAKQLQRQLGK